MAKSQLTITLDPEVKELLRSLAKEMHMNISQYVTYLTIQNNKKGE